MTIYGVSYWQRDPRKAWRDINRMRDQGFDWINVPISSERLAFDAEGVKHILESVRMAGMEARVSPWGVAGLFGGEGVNVKGDALDIMSRWLDQAQRLAPDAIYWDEPQSEQTLALLEGLSRDTNLPQHLYINRNLTGAPSDAVLDRMTTLGIDCYDGNADDAAALANTLAEAENMPVHVWLRAFRIDADDADRPGQLMRELRRRGVDEIAVWGYPSAGCSVLNNARPRRTWNGIVAAMSDLDL